MFYNTILNIEIKFKNGMSYKGKVSEAYTTLSDDCVNYETRLHYLSGTIYTTKTSIESFKIKPIIYTDYEGERTKQGINELIKQENGFKIVECQYDYCMLGENYEGTKYLTINIQFSYGYNVYITGLEKDVRAIIRYWNNQLLNHMIDDAYDPES